MSGESSIITFRDLETWRAGMDLVVAVYGLTRLLPDSERFVLSAQMRRSALSIPANVAEGQRRRIPRVYLNHVSIALGSEGELETQIELARRLGFVKARLRGRSSSWLVECDSCSTACDDPSRGYIACTSNERLWSCAVRTADRAPRIANSEPRVTQPQVY
jgi:four helix bundle protein